MSDERLRQLERAAATGGPEERARLQRALDRLEPPAVDPVETLGVKRSTWAKLGIAIANLFLAKLDVGPPPPAVADGRLTLPAGSAAASIFASAREAEARRRVQEICDREVMRDLARRLEGEG